MNKEEVATLYSSNNTTDNMLHMIALGFCELIDEQKRMNRLLAGMLRAIPKVNEAWLDQVIQECYGDPEQIFKENVLGIKENKDEQRTEKNK